MADTQRQRGGRVRLQNTAQQIAKTAYCKLLLFWLKTDLRSDLSALNCEKFSRGKCFQTSLDLRGYARIRHSAPLT